MASLFHRTVILPQQKSFEEFQNFTNYLYCYQKLKPYEMFFLNGVKDDASVREFKDLDAPAQELINAAIEARKFAYCPYSKFAVGAALRTTDGSIFTGCNVENAAYTAGVCAERVAAAKAISEGRCEFVACAVVAQQECAFTTPCGICRQFLSEFAKKDIQIFCAKPTNPPLRVLCTSILELLPKSFSLCN